jgi:hypothetical protein
MDSCIAMRYRLGASGCSVPCGPMQAPQFIKQPPYRTFGYRPRTDTRQGDPLPRCCGTLSNMVQAGLNGGPTHLSTQPAVTRWPMSTARRAARPAETLMTTRSGNTSCRHDKSREGHARSVNWTACRSRAEQRALSGGPAVLVNRPAKDIDAFDARSRGQRVYGRHRRADRNLKIDAAARAASG